MTPLCTTDESVALEPIFSIINDIRIELRRIPPRDNLRTDLVHSGWVSDEGSRAPVSTSVFGPAIIMVNG